MTAAQSKPSKSRRRWFQFSLRSLLIAVTLVAGLLVAWRVYVEPYRRQRETMKLVEELAGEYTLEPADKWLRWVYGDDFQNLVLVDVADCNDPEEYLEQVAALPKLKTLVVGGLAFTDEDLDRLKEIETLSGLVLDSTSVTDDGIGALKNALPLLAIHKSQRRAIVALGKLRGGLSSETTELSGKLPKLRRLVGDEYFKDATFIGICQSTISDADLTHLKGLTSLQRLVLWNTPVSHLEGLPELRWLHLAGISVNEAILAHLKGLTNLQELWLSRTQVSDAEMAHLGGLTSLQKLYLRKAQVSEAGLAHLKGLTNLQELWLWNTPVSHLEGLSELRSLHLAGTSVNEAILAHLKGLTNLQTLDLRFTQVSDDGLAHLKGLTNLQTLNLHTLQVSEAGVKKLQESLPNCQINCRLPAG